MKDVKKDIAIASVFMMGVWGFISGSFIISALMFCSSSMLSNIYLKRAEFD